ncbi:Alpha/Beta hydrolase protein [Jimgerdemannia flammicorona]|uniref:Carboxylic ester hydrolase n=1 Tax=Jimgerdemannia flammicorona TaxID=994334 RepID=A0A433D437_9FUNG|nr:Alpha/Beta hydrolase protein [Jimgerdemannia flammicorona]
MTTYTGSNLTSVVHTTSGAVQGYVDEDKKINTFLGIPYAEPPVGVLRFKPPKPIATPRQDTIFATFHQKVSLQLPLPFDSLISSESLPQSEDCLYLNVWTPAMDGGKRAVMFWLHSGACMSGSGSQKFWNGANLARNDVVVVTINYRLGALGFMHLADLCGEEWNDAGNLGLLDCIAALQWVNVNIEKFGGDPGKVTVFGASAGGGLSLSLMACPSAKGLFKRAIIQSAPIFMCDLIDWANFKAETFLRSLGLTPDTTDDLYTMDTKRLLEAQLFFLTWPNFFEALVPICPVKDGRTMPKTVIEQLIRGDGPLDNDVEIIIGWTRDEFNLFPMVQDFGKRDHNAMIGTYFTHIFGKNAELAYKIYDSQIIPAGFPPSEAGRYLASDIMCRMGALYLAENLARKGRRVYTYEWDYEPSSQKGTTKAVHIVDAIFSWDNLEYWQGNSSLDVGKFAERDRLSKQISRAFVSFAKTGVPSHEDIPEWPCYDLVKRPSMVFDGETTVRNDLYEKGRRAWMNELEQYVTMPLYHVMDPAKKAESSKELKGWGRKRKNVEERGPRA